MRFIGVELVAVPAEQTSPDTAVASFIDATEILRRIANRLRDKGQWHDETSIGPVVQSRHETQTKN